MESKAITIHVQPEAARVYETAPPEQRRKLDVLLSLRLSEITRGQRSLEEIMSGISRRARRRGMTPEILERILGDG